MPTKIHYFVPAIIYIAKPPCPAFDIAGVHSATPPVGPCEASDRKVSHNPNRARYLTFRSHKSHRTSGINYFHSPDAQFITDIGEGLLSLIH